MEAEQPMTGVGQEDFFECCDLESKEIPNFLHYHLYTKKICYMLMTMIETLLLVETIVGM